MATKLAIPAVPDIRRDEDESEASDNDALIAQALNPDGTPRRPMNAFMIFARRRRPEITANNPPLRTGEISKVLSSEWAAMSAESKQFYLDRARKLKDNFNARWPDYVYRRRPNNSRKRKRPEAASLSVGPPGVRRCAEPMVPSSKIKYEDEHPMVPSMGGPLTMMFLGEAEQGRPGLLGNYNGGPLPSILSGYPRSTPSLASSILTSASTSPRSVSSTLYGRYEQMPVGSPKLREYGAFSSPYAGSLSYLPKSSNSYDEYTRDERPHPDWTPPHAVRNSLQLPFTNQTYYPEPADEAPGSDFHNYQSHSSTEQFDSGLVPVHPHFTRS